VWSLFFLASMAPSTIANVFIERFFMRRYGPSSRMGKRRNYVYDILIINLAGNISQFAILSAFFWVDFLPYFGTCSSTTEFMTGFSESIICLFRPSVCPHAWYLGLIFFGSFFFQFLVSVFMHPETANFVSIATILATPLSVVVLKNLENEYPLNEHGISPPWSIAPAVILLMCGTVTWKLWELTEKIRIKRENQEEMMINS